MDRRGETLLGIFGVVAGVVIVIGFAHWRANYVRHEEVRRAERALGMETHGEFVAAFTALALKTNEDSPIEELSDAALAQLALAVVAAVERIAQSHGMTVDEMEALWARTGTRPMTVKEWRAWEDLMHLMFRTLR